MVLGNARVTVEVAKSNGDQWCRRDTDNDHHRPGSLQCALGCNKGRADFLHKEGREDSVCEGGSEVGGIPLSGDLMT